MPRTISADEVVEMITEFLSEMDGETIADVFNRLSSHERVEYVEDSMFQHYSSVDG